MRIGISTDPVRKECPWLRRSVGVNLEQEMGNGAQRIGAGVRAPPNNHLSGASHRSSRECEGLREREGTRLRVFIIAVACSASKGLFAPRYDGAEGLTEKYG